MPASDPGGTWPPRPLPIPPLDATADVSFSLRAWRITDAADLAAAWQDPELTRWLDPPTSDVVGARRWIVGEPARRESATALDLVIDVEGNVAGEVGLSHFDRARRAGLVGYWVHPDHRGGGLACAALAIVGAFFLDTLGGNALLAQCDPANVASSRTALGAGFSLLRSAADSDVFVLAK